MIQPQRITVEDLRDRDLKKEVCFLDARTPDAWDGADAIVEGAIRIPPAEVENHLRCVPHDKTIVAYCTCPDERSSMRAAEALLYNGWKNARALQGGWKAWKDAGLPTGPKPRDPALAG